MATKRLWGGGRRPTKPTRYVSSERAVRIAAIAEAVNVVGAHAKDCGCSTAIIADLHVLMEKGEAK